MTDLLDLGDERFVSLTTFRRSGEGVATPVWVARHDGALVVTTGPGTGKVKRVRTVPRVTLRPCSRAGHVADDAPTVTGTATVIDHPVQVERPLGALRAKYGVEWWFLQGLLFFERLRRGSAERVIVRIEQAPSSG